MKEAGWVVNVVEQRRTLYYAEEASGVLVLRVDGWDRQAGGNLQVSAVLGEPYEASQASVKGRCDSYETRCEALGE